MLNKIVIIGNITKDPEVRYTPSGAAVCNLRIASSRVWKDKAGEKKEETCFVTVVVWGKRAENCAEQLKKGVPVFIEGRLQSRSWDDANGKKQYATEIVAENIQFLNRTKEGTSEETPTDGEAWDGEQ
jgi:single-strand DNA-binding protein